MKVGEVLRTMQELRNDGMTMLSVTHELGFAYAVADRVLFLHEGEIFEQGTPREILVTPPKSSEPESFHPGTISFGSPRGRRPGSRTDGILSFELF